MRTDAGSLRFADFVACTSASPEPDGVALISPFTPRISSVCPDAIWPRQSKSFCAKAVPAIRDAPHITATAVGNLRMGSSASLDERGWNSVVAYNHRRPQMTAALRPTERKALLLVIGLAAGFRAYWLFSGPG